MSRLNPRCIRKYRSIVDPQRPDADWANEDDDEYLRLIGAAALGDRGVLRPTVAGLLMFGTDVDIVRELPDFFLEYLEYDECEDDYSYRLTNRTNDWTGNIFEFFMLVSGRVRLLSTVPFQIGPDMRRIDDDDLMKFRREILVNALVHADYGGSGGIRVEWHYDRFSARNPGRFRIPVSLAEKGGYSDPRNPTLIQMFRFLGNAERAGSGVRRIVLTCSKLGLSPPDIQDNASPAFVSVSMDTMVRRKESGNIRDEIITILRSDNRASILKMSVRQEAVERSVKTRNRRVAWRFVPPRPYRNMRLE